MFSLSQLVWDFWLLATDGGPEWPFCIRPAQAAATDKSRRGHRCLLGRRAGGSPVAEKHADPGSPNHPLPLWGHPAHAVGRRGRSEDLRAGIEAATASDAGTRGSPSWLGSGRWMVQCSGEPLLYPGDPRLPTTPPLGGRRPRPPVPRAVGAAWGLPSQAAVGGATFCLRGFAPGKRDAWLVPEPVLSFPASTRPQVTSAAVYGLSCKSWTNRWPRGVLWWGEAGRPLLAHRLSRGWHTPADAVAFCLPSHSELGEGAPAPHSPSCRVGGSVPATGPSLVKGQAVT